MHMQCSACACACAYACACACACGTHAVHMQCTCGGTMKTSKLSGESATLRWSATSYRTATSRPRAHHSAPPPPAAKKAHTAAAHTVAWRSPISGESRELSQSSSARRKASVAAPKQAHAAADEAEPRSSAAAYAADSGSTPPPMPPPLRGGSYSTSWMPPCWSAGCVARCSRYPTTTMCGGDAAAAAAAAAEEAEGADGAEEARGSASPVPSSSATRPSARLETQPTHAVRMAAAEEEAAAGRSNRPRGVTCSGWPAAS
jgi:hypothetical protein